MAMSLHANIRYRTIDRCLRNTDKTWTWVQLADACGEALAEQMNIDKRPSRSTIMVDINNMRSGKLGYYAPIDWDRKEKSFYYTNSKFSIDHVPLKKEDMERLNTALLLLKQFSSKNAIKGIERIITELEEKLKVKRKKTKVTIQFEESLNEPGHQWVNDIYDAIKNKQALTISYQPFDKEVYDTVISPYLLKEYNNRWFLFGLSHDYQTISHLGLDRIQAIKSSLQSYQNSKDFDPTLYLEDIVGVTIPKEGKKEEVVIKAYGTQRHYIKTKPIHSKQEIVEWTDEYAIFSLMVIPNYELKSRLLSYQDTLEVLAPLWFREEMAELVGRVGRFYQ